MAMATQQASVANSEAHAEQSDQEAPLVSLPVEGLPSLPRIQPAMRIDQFRLNRVLLFVSEQRIWKILSSVIGV